jgi:hypothetical protein
MATRLSGPALVRAATARLGKTKPFAKRRPLASSALRALDGRASPSLLAWLAFDTRSPNREVSLVTGKRLAVRSAMDLLEELVVSESEGEDWEEETRAAMKELATGLPGEVVLLREPCGQDHFLYLGEADERGEHSVLGLEDEQLFVVEPGFDFYVAGFVDGLVLDETVRKRARAAIAETLGIE